MHLAAKRLGGAAIAPSRRALVPEVARMPLRARQLSRVAFRRQDDRQDDAAAGGGPFGERIVLYTAPDPVNGGISAERCVEDDRVDAATAR